MLVLSDQRSDRRNHPNVDSRDASMSRPIASRRWAPRFRHIWLQRRFMTMTPLCSDHGFQISVWNLTDLIHIIALLTRIRTGQATGRRR
jgi:hypothetical protein